MSKLNDADLALLPALDALLRERNVTRAAARTGMSQPSMSRALARLRRLFDDEILVRGPAGSVPTARALALAEVLPGLLADIERLIRPARFVPESANGRFTIATVDYISLVLMPAVIARLRREAPGLDIDIRDVGMEDVGAAMASGAIDLAIGDAADIVDGAVGARDSGRSGFFRQKLFEDDFVCLLPRRANGAHVQRALTLDAYLALPHAMVTISGRGTGAIDQALERMGRRRRVALRVRPFLAVPWIVASSDVVVTTPRRLGERMAPRAGVRVAEVPLPLGPIVMSQVWHTRRHKDPAHAWLREVVSAEAHALDRRAGPRRTAAASRSNV